MGSRPFGGRRPGSPNRTHDLPDAGDLTQLPKFPLPASKSRVADAAHPQFLETSGKRCATCPAMPHQRHSRPWRYPR